ncbi:damage-control phosphatase ARMT1 family protein [Actinomadura sp. 6N118]|uniref:damage-control phosphatase ARMT1 family protein n=1 Tax=Actinomadura sp. 6N118 TaxID=3375151 RepID=UPI00379B7B34
MPIPDADARLMADERPVPMPDAPELLNNDPESFAWGVLHDRTPKLINQIRDALPYEPRQRRALDELLDEIRSGTVQPLPANAHDKAAWDRWGSGYYGLTWEDLPFLWSESYFYRRLLDAIDFFQPGPWFWVDPFEHLKTAELQDPALEADLVALDQGAQLPVEEQARAKLLASLWGNRADLGFRVGMAPGSDHPEQEGLVADDSATVWQALEASAGSKVCLVADNAGRELLADLVLIDHLLDRGTAVEVVLHVKPQPYYVSDAVTADVVACLRRLAATRGEANKIAQRLKEALADGRLGLHTHWFYCAPWSFHRMPTDLAHEFELVDLTILKGDLNYRRLVGDRNWPTTTPFSETVGYFPGRVAALRTLKSDVVTGIDPDALAVLDATNYAWRTNGTHGLVQLHL